VSAGGRREPADATRDGPGDRNNVTGAAIDALGTHNNVTGAVIDRPAPVDLITSSDQVPTSPRDGAELCRCIGRVRRRLLQAHWTDAWVGRLAAVDPPDPADRLSRSSP